MSEAQLVRSILALLRRHGHATKINTGPLGHVGTPDVLGCVNGRTIVLEVKRPGGKATPAQAEQLRRWRDAGAVALVVTSVGEVERTVAEIVSQYHDTP